MQKDQAGKDVQQVRAIKDRDGNVLTSDSSLLRRWKEHFQDLKKMKENDEDGLSKVSESVEN